MKYTINNRDDTISIRGFSEGGADDDIPLSENVGLEPKNVEEPQSQSETLGQRNLINEIQKDLESFEKLENSHDVLNNEATFVIINKDNKPIDYNINKFSNAITKIDNMDTIRGLCSSIKNGVNDIEKITNFHDVLVATSVKLVKENPEINVTRNLRVILECFLDIVQNNVKENKMIGDKITSMAFNVLFIYNKIVKKISQNSTSDNNLNDLYNTFKQKLNEHIELFTKMTNARNTEQMSQQETENYNNIINKLKEKIAIITKSIERYNTIVQENNTNVNNIEQYVSDYVKNNF